MSHISGNRSLYKTVLLGEGGVGKTSLRHRYLGEGFKANYMATIGADFAVKRLDANQVVQIWDLAGQVRFAAVREAYYLGTKGALVVYDVSRPESFYAIPSWIGELMNNISSEMPPPIVLVANKADLRSVASDNFVSAEQGRAYAEQLSQWAELEVPYVETSAKTGLNVDLIFDTLVENINYRDGATYYS